MYLTIDNKAKKVESSPKKIGRNCPPPNALCGGGGGQGNFGKRLYFFSFVFRNPCLNILILGRLLFAYKHKCTRLNVASYILY